MAPKIADTTTYCRHITGLILAEAGAASKWNFYSPPPLIWILMRAVQVFRFGEIAVPAVAFCRLNQSVCAAAYSVPRFGLSSSTYLQPAASYVAWVTMKSRRPIQVLILRRLLLR